MLERMAPGARKGSHEEAPIHRGQMVRILRKAGKETVPKVARCHVVSEPTIYTCRKRYGDLDVADVRRLRELEAGNAQLKNMVAEPDLEIDEGDREQNV